MTDPVDPPVPPAPVFQPAPTEPVDDAASPYAAPAAAAAPAGIAYSRSPLVMVAVAVVLLIAGIGNFVLSFGFPQNAPVEWVLNVGTSSTLVMGAIALGIIALATSRVTSTPKPFVTRDGLAFTGLILTGAAFVMWLLLGGGGFIMHVVTGEGLRYMYDVNGIFWAGIPWVLGIIFGAIGYRQGAGRGNLFALLAVGVGLLLIVPTLASAVIYALDISA